MQQGAAGIHANMGCKLVAHRWRLLQLAEGQKCSDPLVQQSSLAVWETMILNVRHTLHVIADQADSVLCMVIYHMHF